MKYKYFTFSLSDPDETGLVLVSVEDERTGFTVRTALPQSGVQTASIMAFAGARFSRSDMSAHGIFQEIKDSGTDAQQKLANIFKNYGHSSVADMALLFAYIEQVPDNYHVEFFYGSRIGAGQVRSTRYQDFSQSYPPKFTNYVKDKKRDFTELESEYLSIYSELIELNKKYITQVRQEFKSHYKPENDNKAHESALQARTFDTARAFLPMGANTSFAYITSAREWARMISVMKSDNRYMINCLGEQLELLFAPPEDLAQKLNYVPEAPDLIRHTERDSTLEQSLNAIQKFFKGQLARKSQNNTVTELPQTVELITELKSSELVIYQSLLTFYPQLTIQEFKHALAQLRTEEQEALSKILYDNFTHHIHLGRQAETSSYAFKISATYAELKDLNRHRAWGRFAPVWETENMEEIINSGYILPLYLQLDEFSKLKREIKQDMERIYDRILSYYKRLPNAVNKRMILNILPDAQKIDYYMHAGPKEISYLTNLRVRPGGHINYRILAFMMAKKIADFDPLLSGLQLPKVQKPDPASRKEFFDRS